MPAEPPLTPETVTPEAARDVLIRDTNLRVEGINRRLGEIAQQIASLNQMLHNCFSRFNGRLGAIENRLMKIEERTIAPAAADDSLGGEDAALSERRD